MERYAEEMTAAARRLVDASWRAPPARPAPSSAGPPAPAPCETVIRDVYADFNELTLEVAMATLFGVDASGTGAGGGEDASLVASCVERALACFVRRGAGPGLLVPEWVPTTDNLELAAAVAQLDAVVYAVIRDRRAELAADGGGARGRSDLLQALLLSVDDAGQGAAVRRGGGATDAVATGAEAAAAAGL